LLELQRDIEDVSLDSWLDSHHLTVDDLDNWGIAYTTDRLVIPAYSWGGRYCFDVYRQFFSEPRYYYSPDRCRPSSILFGISKNWNLIKYSGFIVVVEGVSDVISLSKVDIPSVAVLGSRLSKIQKSLLSVIGFPVIVWGDDDGVGERFAIESVTEYNQIGITVQGGDPAEHSDSKNLREFFDALANHRRFSYIKFDNDYNLVEAIERFEV